MEKRVIIALLIIPCAFILLWLAAIIKCEILTNLHGDEFKNQSEFAMQFDKLKVLNYSDTNAKVYYFTPSKGGIVFKYTKNNSIWDEQEKIAGWSLTKTPNNIIWPYAYHSAKGIIQLILIGFLLIAQIILLCLLLKHKQL